MVELVIVDQCMEALLTAIPDVPNERTAISRSAIRICCRLSATRTSGRSYPVMGLLQSLNEPEYLIRSLGSLQMVPKRNANAVCRWTVHCKRSILICEGLIEKVDWFSQEIQFGEPIFFARCFVLRRTRTGFFCEKRRDNRLNSERKIYMN